MKYQHIKPQREQDHVVTPATAHRILKSGKKQTYFLMPLICNECGNKIKQVPDNDGPEGLKALLSF